MGTPAHTHHDSHPSVLGDPDTYEVTMGNDYTKSNHEDAGLAGGIINPINGPYDPLKYLFYTTNQIAQFFPSDDKPGNNTYTNSNDPFYEYRPLQEIINELGTVSPTDVNVDQIRETALEWDHN